MTEERISEIKDRSTEIIQSEEQRLFLEHSLKKMNRASGNLWKNIKRSNICVTAVLKEEKKVGTVENIWRNNDPKCPKFGDRSKFTNSRSLANPKQDRLKENDT